MIQRGAQNQVEGFKQKKATFYDCSNCGMVSAQYFRSEKSLRPNNKFCDKICMEHVIRTKSCKSQRLPAGATKWLADLDESRRAVEES